MDEPYDLNAFLNDEIVPLCGKLANCILVKLQEGKC
jgi:hypothetical protein